MLKKISALIAALLLTSNAAKAQSAEFINILTGGTAGVYYPLGSALTKIYGDNIKGSKVQVQVTKASVENLNLIQEGKGEIAFVLGDSAKDAWAITRLVVPGSKSHTRIHTRKFYLSLILIDGQ